MCIFIHSHRDTFVILISIIFWSTLLSTSSKISPATATAQTEKVTDASSLTEAIFPFLFLVFHGFLPVLF